MTIYLACTVRGDRAGVQAARAISARLERHGHRVLTLHLLNDDVDDLEASLTSQSVFQRDVKWLDKCDALVAEASGSSYGVGFEVGYVCARAPTTGQRVFLLYDAARRSSVSRLVAGNNDSHCTTFAYDSPAALERFIDHHFGPIRSAPRLP
jgi:nucleoside 2-deoxyribosyltransferase